MPIITCKNPKGPGTWLKHTSAYIGDQTPIRSASSLKDDQLVWVKNGQQIAYTQKAKVKNHYSLSLNLRGHKKLLAYEGHFPELLSEAKSNLEHKWKFYPQTDNDYLSSSYNADNTCNSSSCAMYLEFFKPTAIKDDQQYVNQMYNAGFQSTNHDHQTIMLERYGVKSRFNYFAHWNDLIKETNKGYPTTVGFYHRGSKWSPRGGHVGLLIDATDKWVEMLDPYGNMLDGYTTSVYNGYRVIYPRHQFEPRWVGGGKGWMRHYIG